MVRQHTSKNFIKHTELNDVKHYLKDSKKGIPLTQKARNISIESALRSIPNHQRESLEKFLLSEEHSKKSQFIFNKNLRSPKKYCQYLCGSDDEDIKTETNS